MPMNSPLVMYPAITAIGAAGSMALAFASKVGAKERQRQQEKEDAMKKTSDFE